MDENSTAIKSTGENITEVPDVSLDLTWQLAMAINLYFKYAVLVMAIFGTAANGLTIYALLANNARDAKKRVINLLIINQNVLDLLCCILFIISACIQIYNIYLMGAFGYFLCAFFVNDRATHCALHASIFNLVAVTVERYLKVVHPFWSKKNLKRWVVYVAMAFAWIGGIMYVVPTSFLMSRVENGSCLRQFYSGLFIHQSCTLTIFFFLPLIVFVYCYRRIVFVMRRQMRVMAGHTGEGSSQMNAPQAQSKRIKWNIIKTMIIVSISFVVSWSPINILTLHVTFVGPTTFTIVGLYPAMFLVYLNICMNPFIYGLKHEGVKQELARLFSCRKTNSVGNTSRIRSSNRANTTT